jgi:hypothetical protein
MVAGAQGPQLVHLGDLGHLHEGSDPLIQHLG